ncbi:hypothetical protein ACLI4U_19210 (plasmid) [Natrialbaceae archaeon A-CW2]
MSDDTDIDEIAQLRRRINAVDDYAKQYITGQIEARDDRIEELEDRVNRLEGIVLEVQEAVEGVTGLAKSEKATPEKRAADIRTVLIRRAHGRDAKGAQMWWREVRDALLDLGHDDLQDKDKAKPLVHNAMERAVEADGFDMTTKHAEVRKNLKREVKAVRVKLEELPVQDTGKEFTTDGTPTPASGEMISGTTTENLSD